MELVGYEDDESRSPTSFSSRVVHRELKAEIEKLNNIALYEKMAKEHPENPRLAELVSALKELEE